MRISFYIAILVLTVVAIWTFQPSSPSGNGCIFVCVAILCAVNEWRVRSHKSNLL